MTQAQTMLELADKLRSFSKEELIEELLGALQRAAAAAAQPVADEFPLDAGLHNLAFPEPPPTPAGDTGDTEDRMEKISALIARLQETKDRWGDTCVYIRRGGLAWGAVALNRRADDEKHGVFDLQAQHDRDMLERLEQIERLKSSRDRAEKQLREALAAHPAPQTDGAR